MDKYMSCLIQQFVEAKGYEKKYSNKNKFFKKKLINEFIDWIFIRKEVSKEYLELLKRMCIDIDNSKCAEIGKGCFDSSVINSECNIITPYVKGFDKISLIDSNFEVIDGKPSFNNYKGSILNGLILDNVDTYITENVYDSNLIKNWEDLSKSGYNIIVGAYGNKGDKDINHKIKMLEELKNKISSAHEGFCINPGSYCYFITNKKR